MCGGTTWSRSLLIWCPIRLITSIGCLLHGAGPIIVALSRSLQLSLLAGSTYWHYLVPAYFVVPTHDAGRPRPDYSGTGFQPVSVMFRQHA